MKTADSDSPRFDEAAFSALYAERLGEFQLAWSVFLLRYTARLREAVGEIDDVLILVALTIASTVGNPQANATGGFGGTEGPFADGTAPPTNAVRLSEMTGIPRETVRRRLVGMAGRGWLEQSGPPRREWRLAIGPEGWPRVAREMGAVHADFLRDMTRLLGRWDRLARDAGWDALTRPPRPPAPGATPPARGPVAR